MRQVFINTSYLKEEGIVEHATYINYHDVRKIMIKDVDYIALPRKVSNHVLKQLDKNWVSFFASIKDYGKNQTKYSGKPKLPNYKDKTNGRCGLSYELGAISTKERKKGYIKLSGTEIKVPFINTEYKLIGSRIVVLPTGYFKIEIIYDRPVESQKLPDGKFLGIDPGVNNLVTLTSNKLGLKPIIVNGGPVKSINQYYNKELAKMRSELPDGVYNSKAMQCLTEKRNNKIEAYFHKTSNLVIETAQFMELGHIVIGKNIGWKDEVDMGKKNNQNFVSIPFEKLFAQIKYKAELLGITVEFVEESYTSKSSFLNSDPIPCYEKEKGVKARHIFSGYRESRGMYKIRGKKIRINADVNGSYNIIRKAAPNAFIDGVEGFAVIPVKVTFHENKKTIYFQ